MEYLGGSLEWIGWMSSLELGACAVGSKKLEWNGNSNSNVQFSSSIRIKKPVSLYLVWAGVLFLVTGTDDFLLRILYRGKSLVLWRVTILSGIISQSIS